MEKRRRRKGRRGDEELHGCMQVALAWEEMGNMHSYAFNGGPYARSMRAMAEGTRATA